MAPRIATVGAPSSGSASVVGTPASTGAPPSGMPCGTMVAGDPGKYRCSMSAAHCDGAILNAARCRRLRWRSRQFTMSAPGNIGCARRQRVHTAASVTPPQNMPSAARNVIVGHAKFRSCTV